MLSGLQLEYEYLKKVYSFSKRFKTKVRIISKTSLSLQRKFKIKFGGLAHPARARHWQCRGDRFESDNLHHEKAY